MLAKGPDLFGTTVKCFEIATLRCVRPSKYCPEFPYGGFAAHSADRGHPFHAMAGSIPS